MRSRRLVDKEERHAELTRLEFGMLNTFAR